MFESPDEPHRRNRLTEVFGGLAPLVTALLLSGCTLDRNAAGQAPVGQQETTEMTQHPYAGMWVTADGRVRHELLANGRYDEARGTRESAYQGRYEVEGDHIEYWDDTGFTADGDFVSLNELHHGGMILFRRTD